MPLPPSGPRSAPGRLGAWSEAKGLLEDARARYRDVTAALAFTPIATTSTDMATPIATKLSHVARLAIEEPVPPEVNCER